VTDAGFLRLGQIYANDTKVAEALMKSLLLAMKPNQSSAAVCLSYLGSMKSQVQRMFPDATRFHEAPMYLMHSKGQEFAVNCKTGSIFVLADLEVNYV